MVGKRWIGIVLGALTLLVGSVPVGASFEGAPGKIVFSRTGDRAGLFVARRDGTEVRRLTRANDGNAEWSPQGDRIAFLRWSKDGFGSLQVMDPDGTGRIGLSPASEEGCAVQAPHWSYDGSLIAYTDDCFDRDPRVAEIRVVTPGGSQSAITDRTSLNRIGRQPWSPDLENSVRLTFTSDRDGDHDVYVMNSDGTKVQQLTDETAFALESAWSPDGSAIAYTVQDPNRPRSSVWTVSPSGGTPALLIEGTPHAGDALWSPDGSRLAFTRRTRVGVPTLVVANADGSDEIEIAAGSASQLAAWSPNSRALLVSHEGRLVRFRLGPPLTRKVLIKNASDYQSADWQAR